MRTKSHIGHAHTSSKHRNTVGYCELQMNTRTKERKEQEVKDPVHHELQITVPVLYCNLQVLNRYITVL